MKDIVCDAAILWIDKLLRFQSSTSVSVGRKVDFMAQFPHSVVIGQLKHYLLLNIWNMSELSGTGDS